MMALEGLQERLSGQVPSASALVSSVLLPCQDPVGEERSPQKPGEVAQDVTRNFVLVTA